jgi:O-glycosyl hydrolase
LFTGPGAGSVAAATTVAVDLDRTYQMIEGFGTCLISWGGFPGRTYTDEMARIYADDMGLNILRSELGGFTVPDPLEPDAIDFRDFDLGGHTGKAKIFLDFAARLEKVNPDMLYIGTVWSPPGWMKKHGQEERDPKIPRRGKRPNLGIDATTYGRTENYVTREHYPHFVAWLAEMAELWEANGTPLMAISPGNEVQFSQNFQSCVWIAEDYATIVTMLGEELERRGMDDLLIFGPETMTGHNYPHGNPHYVREIRNSEAHEHLDIWATHGYVDGFVEDHSATSYQEFRNLIGETDKPLWITEGGTGEHEWPSPLTGVAAAIHNSFVHGDVSAFVPWQISGDKPSQHNLMVGHKMTKKSHAVRHFSKTIERGARRAEATADGKQLMASAYHHPETGQLSIVLINPSGEDHSIALRMDGARGLERFVQYRTSAEEDFEDIGTVPVKQGAASFTLPAQSMVSLVGQTTSGGTSAVTTAEPISPFRDWTSSEDASSTVRAALVSVGDEAVLIRMEGHNRNVWVGLDKFSEADRRWVAENFGP